MLPVFSRAILIVPALAIVMVLSACDKKATVDPALQGSWELRLLVPDDQQGRCVDEKITFDQTSWRSDVVVHSTFACNQPYYAVSYKGDVIPSEVVDDSEQSEYPDTYIQLQVKNIKLVAVADINKGEFDYLSETGVANMQSRLLGSDHYELTQMINVRHNHIRSKVFEPVLAFVTEKYKHKDAFHVYNRRY